MKFVVDESIDRHIADRLCSAGHTIWAIAEVAPGMSDDAVLDLANAHDALLLTADKDFGELIFRRQRTSAGIILIRLAGLSPERKAEVVAQSITKHANELPLAFTVITPRTIRIRHRLS